MSTSWAEKQAARLARLRVSAQDVSDIPTVSKYRWAVFTPCFGSYSSASGWRCNGFWKTKAAATYHAQSVACFSQFIVGKVQS